MTLEDKLSQRSMEMNIWSAENLKKHVMNWLLSQQYSHVILVSGYPVLPAVNLPNYECLLSSYTQVTGSNNSWKCDTSHWFPGSLCTDVPPPSGKIRRGDDCESPTIITFPFPRNVGDSL